MTSSPTNKGFEMTAEQKERILAWVEALESGEYIQGHGKLRIAATRLSEPQYCCLGVACDLAAKAGVGHWAGSVFIGEEDFGPESEALLPEFVSDWFGGIALRGSGNVKLELAGTTAAGGRHKFATEMNDNGEDFLTIAAAIRRTFGLPPRRSADV